MRFNVVSGLVKLSVLFLSAVFMSSCASLYGKAGLPKLPVEQIPKSQCSVTFRVLKISMWEEPAVPAYCVANSSVEDEADYLKQMDVFKEVKIDKPKFTFASFKSQEDRQRFLDSYIPDFDTDLYVDVLITEDQNTNWSGGGLISIALTALTLGTFPIVFDSDVSFQIVIHRKGWPALKGHIDDSFFRYSSNLFFLVPSSETANWQSGSVPRVTMTELNHVANYVAKAGCNIEGYELKD